MLIRREKNRVGVPWDQFGGPGCPQMKSIRSKWNELLRSDKLQERYYHDFIARNAHVFFPMKWSSIQVLSKIRLGAELVTDFVIVRDEGSYGLAYQLIEIERPWDIPFTKDGIASARLTRAIHQILDWKRWIEEHRIEARKLFPSFLHLVECKPLFQYCIIIGTRKNSHSWLDKRNQLSETLGISIRSFDWLTEHLQHRSESHFFHDEYTGGGAEEDQLEPIIRNALANPFVRAMSDPEWREFISGRFNFSHMVGHNAERLLKFRRTNSYEKNFLSRVTVNASSRSGAKGKKISK
jgi:hypothetical protein